MHVIVKATATALAAVLAALAALTGPAAAAPGHLRARVVDPDGDRVRGVVVSAVDPVDTSVVAGSDVTNGGGMVQIRHLTSDEYGVFVDGSAAGHESGYLACDHTVVPTYGEACTTSPGNLGEIVLDPLP